MIIDKDFLRIAREAFDPFTPFSGTENVGPLLYSLTRLVRPRVAVECGSGYTTLFLLAALEENAADIEEESALLRDKTAALGDLQRINLRAGNSELTQWFGGGGKACGVDPAYYLAAQLPHLYSFEEKDASDGYTQRMRNVVAKLNLGRWFSHLQGSSFSVTLLPREAQPIDLAWVDAHEYKEFFEACWPYLNPKGGIIIFHNTVARKYGWNAIQWMKARRAAANDLEVMTLPESHKLDQSSCTILRRVTAYEPPCLTLHPEHVLSNAIKFMETKSHFKREPCSSRRHPQGDSCGGS